jgi:hypothetical protein
VRLNPARAQQYLKAFDFKSLFVEEMGWDHLTHNFDLQVDGETHRFSAVAQKRGMVAFLVTSPGGRIPDHATRRKVEQKATKAVREHLLIFPNDAQTEQVWQWVRREPGKPTASREHRIHKSQSGTALLQKLEAIAFSMDEEEELTLTAVTGRARSAFDLEKVTKRFYERFKAEHATFLKFLKGIPEEHLQRWYASVMLNRLMFIYFIQKKGFANRDSDYLHTKLKEIQRGGKDRYYREFLCPLFFEGFAKRSEDRTPATNRLLGEVPYLNGGLFLQHQVERLHGKTIAVADAAFEKLFDFFEQYQWHLDERPLKNDNEINPDVLGYIFEKYINQKQMGAYYTKEDITGYIGKNTILPLLLEKARENCKVAFDPGSALWKLLQESPDRYLYEAVRRGVVNEKGDILPESALPDFVQKGMRDPKTRMFDRRYNLGTAEILDREGNNLALPTETWREYIERRKRCLDLRAKLRAGEIHEVSDLITYNLDIRQFVQDAVETCEGPDLLRAFWKAIVEVSVLDPTCGSGAFLFAALNILDPLYESCLDRMEAFLGDLERSGEKHRPEKFSDFRNVLQAIEEHPNRRYFVFKSIMVNNLFGVDIMEEAVEICKLRLFLKLVAQVDDSQKIEPLPDIDFNIRSGNTLVGFARLEDVRKTLSKRLSGLGSAEEELTRIQEKAEDVEALFRQFRQQQTTYGGKVAPEDKEVLRARLAELDDELNRYLAGEYGIEAPDPKVKALKAAEAAPQAKGKVVPIRKGGGKAPAFESWLESHKPLHWFVEFYGIMNRGGFDVIIGNPPYVELNQVIGYTWLKYQCADSGNLYAIILERCDSIGNHCGRQGFIVPVSSVSTDRYQSLQTLLLRQSLYVSSFDDRPSRLFDGLEHIRLTIHLRTSSQADTVLFSTKYNKWQGVERPILFDCLRYAESSKDVIDGSIAKFSSSLETSILKKMLCQKRNLSFFMRRKSRHEIYYSRKVGYFLQVLNFEPEVRDGNGNLRPPSEFKAITFDTSAQASSALCCLNASLFYWFITINSDCRHVNKREVEAFPIALERLSLSAEGKILESKAKELMADLKHTSETREMSFSHDSLTVQCIFPKHSKPIIDHIDQVLAKHYGFTDEELDFIINYDIKYRMGRDAGTDEAMD